MEPLGAIENGNLNITVRLPTELVRIPVRDERGDELYVVYDSNEMDVQITVWRNPQFGAPAVTMRSAFSSVLNIPVADMDAFVQELNSRVKPLTPKVRETLAADATDLFLHDFFAAGDAVFAETFRSADALSEIEIALDVGLDGGKDSNDADVQTLDVDLSAGFETGATDAVAPEATDGQDLLGGKSAEFDLDAFFAQMRRTPAKPALFQTSGVKSLPELWQRVCA